MSALARFVQKTERDHETGCVVWQGARAGGGYGTFWVDGRQVAAHRFAYEAFVGPVPEGAQLDHLCRNRACVNVFHLEPVAPVENVARAVGHNASKTHCVNGHAFDEENTYQRKTGGRACRACMRDIARRRREEKPDDVRAAQARWRARSAA